MKENNEVTLKIKVNIDEFKKVLEEKKYVQTDHYILYDTFMVPENLEIERLSTREIISKSIIIRKAEDIMKNEIRQEMLHKMKKINENGEIIEQRSIMLKVLDCSDVEKFMSTIGYKKIMNITEEDYGYQKDGKNITTKDVKNGDKMIESETVEYNSEFDTIEKIKEYLKAEELPLDLNDCFIKKAEVELNKILNRS